MNVFVDYDAGINILYIVYKIVIKNVLLYLFTSQPSKFRWRSKIEFRLKDTCKNKRFTERK